MNVSTNIDNINSFQTALLNDLHSKIGDSFKKIKASIYADHKNGFYVRAKVLAKYGIIQSMNSAGGRCHDNARFESMWARMKSELLYDRYNTETMTIEELKVLIWRYFISYWNNRRICSANGGIPPIIKRQRYYQSLEQAA